VKKGDGMRWTPRMDEFLRMLTDEPEVPLDGVFAVMVKLQLVMEQVNQMETITPLFATALRARVADIKASIPDGFQDHRKFFSPQGVLGRRQSLMAL